MKKTTTKKKIIFTAVGVIIIMIAYFSWNIIDRFTYSKTYPTYPIVHANNTALTIGIIGDSWVSGEKLDSILHNRLLKRGFENNVLSSGHPGAKSKMIYQNLFKEEEKQHSSKFILKKSPDYCIVIAGVNDAATQVDGHYYSYHMIQIIKTLLSLKIKPIIVPCPEFGIQETMDNLNFLNKKRNAVTAYFYNNCEMNYIEGFRKTLLEDLDSSNLIDSILVINFDNVCANYYNCMDFYANPSHLNKKGNEKFVEVIVDELYKDLIACKPDIKRKQSLNTGFKPFQVYFFYKNPS